MGQMRNAHKKFDWKTNCKIKYTQGNNTEIDPTEPVFDDGVGWISLSQNRAHWWWAFEHSNKLLTSFKGVRITGPDEYPSTSKKGLCSMELVMSTIKVVTLLVITEENAALPTFIWYSFSIPFTKMVACSVTIS
jgi:hypothetical protein